jgi:hypothetical protein
LTSIEALGKALGKALAERRSYYARMGHEVRGRVRVLALAAFGLSLAVAAEAEPAAPTPAAVTLGQRGFVVPPVVEDVEHMCALLTSCDSLPIPPNLVPSDLASCVRQMRSDMAAPSAVAFSLMLRECGLSANSCSELRTCALRGAKPDTCVGRGRQSVAGFCDIDGRALSCSHDRVQAVRDCPRGGEQCAVRQGEALCTLGACPDGIKEGAPPVCSASGTRILRCEHGQLASLDCTAFGLVCGGSAPASGGPAAPTCVPGTAPCAAGLKRCDGNVSVSCYAGHEVRVDCGAASLECAPPNTAGQAPMNTTPVGACFASAPAAGACDPQSAARCDGATIRYCDLGKPRGYLCKSLGFTRCGAATGGGVRCY